MSRKYLYYTAVSICFLAILPLSALNITLQNESFSVDAWYKKYGAASYVLPQLGSSFQAIKHDYSRDDLALEQFKEALQKYILAQIAFHKKNDGISLQQDLPSDQETVYAEAQTIAPGGIVYVVGDLHGDIASLIRMLHFLKNKEVIANDFTLLRHNKPNYLAFCGDFVDQGPYGALVLMVIMRLKLQNPEHVIICARGDHETVQRNVKWGFKQEIIERFGEEGYTELQPILHSFYNTLPAVVYTGRAGNYIQLSHGGLEFFSVDSLLLEARKGYAAELIEEIDRMDFIKNNLRLSEDQIKMFFDQNSKSNTMQQMQDIFTRNAPSKKNITNHCGFIWGGFQPMARDITTWSKDLKGFLFGTSLMEAILEEPAHASKDVVGVFGVISGHQHSGEMLPLLRSSNGAYEFPFENYSIFTLVSTTLYATPAILEVTFAGETPDTWSVFTEHLGKDGKWRRRQLSSF